MGGLVTTFVMKETVDGLLNMAKGSLRWAKKQGLEKHCTSPQC